LNISGIIECFFTFQSYLIACLFYRILISPCCGVAQIECNPISRSQESLFTKKLLIWVYLYMLAKFHDKTHKLYIEFLVRVGKYNSTNT
jgi:hypothetical protein